jgi:maltose alpha-D-glucosyltransferase/alpha-amylase
MAFHFPLMPRIYMALRQEDRLPITDIMAQTPPIPDNCQWGLFLRNHDELTLEMVSNDERDYMYLAYSADPRMRINVGIRRRLAPLVDNNRRRIELLNSLLFSFPGTPIIYYGDEIGMGDNIYLGDRNGVRTPMQWNPDRNAGFSTSVPARLYFPVITDPIWGYQSINVEAQQSDQSSLLHWNRNMIALRKLFRVFGRGTQEFLNPDNRKILAYIREYEEDGAHETVLCVANLSRFSQPVSLDLSRFAGMVPVEMLGYVTFPTITNQPYPLTLAPYAFLWLELQAAPSVPEPVQVAEDQPLLHMITSGIDGVLGDHGELERLLTIYLPRQRWFSAKSRTIESLEVLDRALLEGLNAAILFLQVRYTDGAENIFQMPLAVTTGAAAEAVLAGDPGSVIATVTTDKGPAVLHDAIAREDVRQALLQIIAQNGEIATQQGTLTGRASSGVSLAGETLPGRTGSAEQSNTSILYDAKLIMKLFRRLEPGENPDTEIGRFLTETAHFPRIAPFMGEISLVSKQGEKTTVAMLQGLVENEGDGWQWTLEELSHFYEYVATRPAPLDVGAPASFVATANSSPLALDYDSLYLDAAKLLGRRTAEMHLALATPTDDPAFGREKFSAAGLKDETARIDEQLTLALEALRRNMGQLGDTTADIAALVLSRRLALVARAQAIASMVPEQMGAKTRIHGDYHLGQVLRSHGDYVILDFEGEPARSLESRRKRQSPLRDVAGMLRSFSYASYAGLQPFLQRRPDDAKSLERWARVWQNAVSREFLSGYRQAMEGSGILPSAAEAQTLLDAYLLEKSLYELLYEVNNRPTWVRIPLNGILSISS